ncbi:helix-turn-helix domain-containing protein [Enterococcus faecium]|uniref:helix-turn-helix domain-containing protein n=1 Tax=Enterococcus faecium TaxID=1352 RepID=UPI000F514CCB|nr:helix-turn-helix transcriptional regulator [Enterococcus faecium]ROY69088.1 XRE family transcriptional regulator [Enterococcus faecium]ROY90927.1 XRE family transcriptional regulator [Enterococcus faecium]
MTDIAEITQHDREKIKEYVRSSKNLTYTMLADRFGISKSELSLIINGKKTTAEANRIIDSIITMYEL